MKRLYYFIVSIALAPQLVKAQIRNPIEFDSLSEFLAALLDLIIMISIPIIVLLVIYAGFLFVTAGGNREQLSRAKVTLLWTLVGALIILGARAIADLVAGTVEDITAE